jgi:hypothetical protein
VEDFRSDKMETREGGSVAKRAWDSYVKAVNKRPIPVIEPIARRFSVNKAVDLMGFWVAWHLHGGFEGLRKIGMAERTIFRQVAWFRMAYGEHPDTFRFPGIKLDREAYFAAGDVTRKGRGK